MNDNPIIDFMARRRSASALGLQAPGPDNESLSLLLRIAMRAPDHGKLTPWRMMVIEGAAKARLVESLASVAATRPDARKAGGALNKLARPPLCVAVISCIRPAAVPEWEQVLSAGAVCMNLVTASLAMGFGANWITGWYAYDPEALALYGISANERIAGLIMIGTASVVPDERPRPDLAALVTHLS